MILINYLKKYLPTHPKIGRVFIQGCQLIPRSPGNTLQEERDIIHSYKVSQSAFADQCFKDPTIFFSAIQS